MKRRQLRPGFRSPVPEFRGDRIKLQGVKARSRPDELVAGEAADQALEVWAAPTARLPRSVLRQQSHRPHGPDVKADSRVQPLSPEHEVWAIASSPLDGFRHVEDDPGLERLAPQPEGSVDLVVLRADRADAEMDPVDGQGEPAPTALVASAAHG